MHFFLTCFCVFQDGAVFMLNAILPAVGTEKRVTWTVKTLMRRGVAQRLLCRLDDAIQDFSQVNYPLLLIYPPHTLHFK